MRPFELHLLYLLLQYKWGKKLHRIQNGVEHFSIVIQTIIGNEKYKSHEKKYGYSLNIDIDVIIGNLY